jgi:pimeloyl-ACP methyl ester carboxylesterase
LAVATAIVPRSSRADQGDDSEGRCVYKDRDFFVPHVSTIPANKGQQVSLFVRERGNSCGPPVLMLTGATQPAMVPFDLPYEDYSWMTYLANAGFDVFAMDLQGYGLSTRPAVMDDPCNAALSAQSLLIPPLAAAGVCPPEFANLTPYNNLLTWSYSEWDEIDSVVNYILAARHRESLSLIGWSQGGPRAGGYASKHPEKVDRLFLYAPAYNRLDPTSPTGAFPRTGSPISVNTVAAFYARWNGMAKCPDEFDPAIRTAPPGAASGAGLTATLLQFDPLAATWGTQPLWRSPAFNLPPSSFDPESNTTVAGRAYGWNSAAAAKIHMPTLLIRGDNDTQVPPVEASVDGQKRPVMDG